MWHRLRQRHISFRRSDPILRVDVRHLIRDDVAVPARELHSTVSANVPGWRIYLPAFVLALPALVAWAFCFLFISPKCRLIWELGGIETSNVAIDLISGLASASFMYLGVIIVAIVLIVIVIDRLAKGSTVLRRWLTGTILFCLYTFVLLCLLCQLIVMTIIAPIFHMRSEHLANHAQASGSLTSATETWEHTGRKFPLYSPDGNEDIAAQIDALIGTLNSGSIPSVKRGTVGALLGLQISLSADQSDRFLESLERLAERPLKSISEAQSWFQSVQDDPKWQSVPIVRGAR